MEIPKGLIMLTRSRNLPKACWNLRSGIILSELGFEVNQIDEICEIVAHHHSPGKITTANFGILYDADWLVNLSDEFDVKDHKKLGNIIDRVFLTQTGKTLARTVCLRQEF